GASLVRTGRRTREAMSESSAFVLTRCKDELVWRPSVLAISLVLASGCGGPIGVKAPSGEAGSSDGGAMPTRAATTRATTTTTDAPDRSRPPPPPFELPEGCGDGVIVPGQYDCFFPVPLDWVEEDIGGYLALHPLDLEGDGRDEMIALYGGRNI